MSGYAFLNNKINFEYVYADCDSHVNEISELYSYSEEGDFIENRLSFQTLLEEIKLPNKWSFLNEKQQTFFIDKLANSMDLADRKARRRCIRATLYLLQGIHGECLLIEDQSYWTSLLVPILYKKDFFQMFVQLLLKEIKTNPFSCSDSKKLTRTLKDSKDFRLILSALYIFVEVMMRSFETDTDEIKKLKEQFKNELCEPLAYTGELFACTLFQMISKFCDGTSSHYPIRKILLLLWKVLLLTLGGIEKLNELKKKYRENAKLKPFDEDPIKIIQNMRPCSPELGEKSMMKKEVFFKRQASVVNWDDLDMFEDESIQEDNEQKLNVDENDQGYENVGFDNKEENDKTDKEETNETINHDKNIEKINKNNTGTAKINFKNTENLNKNSKTPLVPVVNKCLPWVAKVRTKDINAFLDQVRSKSVGFTLPNNRTTTIGLPELTMQSLKVLYRYQYVSLAEAQMEREEEFFLYPLITEELDNSILNSPAEKLYKEILPELPQFMIALLKILFAALPSAKNKSEMLNIVYEVIPKEQKLSLVDNMKNSIDINRQKEIIIKAVSAILILILKHYKINHIYQFEYISQQLMLANCIPLILKFMNQDIFEFIINRYTISVIDFPACVIGEQAELTNEILESGWSDTPFSWRNIFSCINLLRVINKLTKWKESRIQTLIYFKANATFMKVLLVKQAMMQVYVLKLIKMLIRHFSKQTRKNSIHVISMVYQKVRHRLIDDWVYSNVANTKYLISNFQKEEFHLQTKIKLFHQRRYNKNNKLDIFNDSNERLNSMSKIADFLGVNADEEEIENVLLSTSDEDIILNENFKNNYEEWLNEEVFKNQTDWDKVLTKIEKSDFY